MILNNKKDDLLLLPSNGLSKTNEQPKAVHRFFMINIDMYRGTAHFLRAQGDAFKLVVLSNHWL